MSLKYNHLLSPIEINGVMLRNRLICTASNPHFIQATEKWPTEALISHYANKAKAGAAVVTVKGNNPVKTNDPHSPRWTLPLASTSICSPSAPTWYITMEQRRSTSSCPI